jgi:hypothetical protein
MHTYSTVTSYFVGFEVLATVVMSSSGIQGYVVHWKLTDVSQNHVASNFKVEE